MRPVLYLLGLSGLFLLSVYTSYGQGIQLGYRLLTTDFDRSIGFRPGEQDAFPNGVGLQILSAYTPYFAIGADLKVSKIRNANDELIASQEGELLFNLSALARVQKMTSGGWFKPYFQGGLGLINTRPETRWSPSILAGMGIDLEVLPGLLIGAGASYTRELIRNRYHMEYSIGISIPLNRPGTNRSERELIEVLADADENFEDSDGDGIEDNQDDCPMAVGTLMTKGCPDQDEDGVADALDDCPDQPGLVGNNGCPIFEPYEATHPAEIRDSAEALARVGLDTLLSESDLDTDGDGIPDEFDDCPEAYGSVDRGGCPAGDRDNDGVSDEKDACPDQFGSIYNQGCPESVSVPKRQDTTENEGQERDLLDSKDIVQADTEKNEEASGGVDESNETAPKLEPSGENAQNPVDHSVSNSKPDKRAAMEVEPSMNDEPTDSVIDPAKPKDEVSKNAAPQTIIVRESMDDRDGDGIADHIDPCPDEAGSLVNKGCPAEGATKEVSMESTSNTDVGAGAFSDKGIIGTENFEFAPMIHFQSGVAVLQRKYVPELEKIASFLRFNPEYHLRIYGHTDSQGSTRSNDYLSRKRAKACYTFLTVSEGIDPNRLAYFGQGEEVPISDNLTARGRYQNRRVVFDFIRR